MQSIIERIDELKKDYSLPYQFSERKRIIFELINDFNSLIQARRFLSDRFIDDLSGIYSQEIKDNAYLWTINKNKKIGMSYLQIKNYIVNYAKTGKHLKKPYNITNKKELSY